MTFNINRQVFHPLLAIFWVLLVCQTLAHPQFYFGLGLSLSETRQISCWQPSLACGRLCTSCPPLTSTSCQRQCEHSPWCLSCAFSSGGCTFVCTCWSFTRCISGKRRNFRALALCGWRGVSQPLLGTVRKGQVAVNALESLVGVEGVQFMEKRAREQYWQRNLYFIIILSLRN